MHKFGEGVQLQLLQLGFWILVGLGILVMVWNLFLVFFYSFLVRTIGERCTSLGWLLVCYRNYYVSQG
jgi:hypothetical protein